MHPDSGAGKRYNFIKTSAALTSDRDKLNVSSMPIGVTKKNAQVKDNSGSSTLYIVPLGRPLFF